MKRALWAFLWVACAGCATTTDRPDELLSVPVRMPACVLFCFIHVTATDNGPGKPPPQPPEQPRHETNTP